MRLTKTSVLTTALFVSLIANVWLASHLAGKQAGSSPGGSAKAEKGLYRIAGDLPADQRREIETIIASRQDALAQKREEIRLQRDRIRSLLKEKKLDERQLQEAFARHRELLDGLQLLLQEQTIDIALALPRKERAKMVDSQRSPSAPSGKHPARAKSGKGDKKDTVAQPKQP